MKWRVVVLAICVASLVTSCGETTAPVAPASDFSPAMMLRAGTILVFVHWEGEGVPGKRVELLGLHREMKTDEEGIAEFIVRPGTYTVRVYDLNRGGPPMWYVDTKVTVVADEVTRVEVVDCLPCV
jgi:hypothetical protein